MKLGKYTMQLIRNVSDWWRPVKILLILSLIFFSVGPYNFFFRKSVIVSHFNDISAKFDKARNVKTQIIVVGQYKTEAQDFVAGEVIQIDMMLILDLAIYNQLKAYFWNGGAPNGFVIVSNAEDPRKADIDVNKYIRKLDFDSSFVNKGFLEPVSFADSTQRISLSGEVIFTTGGKLKFGQPLGSIFKDNKIQLNDIEISPRYVKTQIETNKLIEFLTFITIGVALLALYSETRGRHLA